MKNQLFTRIISKLLVIAVLTVCLCGCSVSDANKLLGIDGLNGSTEDKTGKTRNELLMMSIEYAIKNMEIR